MRRVTVVCAIIEKMISEISISVTVRDIFRVG